VYAANMAVVDATNADPNASYKMGENLFSDLTEEEFVATLSHDLKGFDLSEPSESEQSESETEQGSPNLRRRMPASEEAQHEDRELQSAPSSVDWRALGAVGPVRNQGGCGSDWAFATVAAIEGAWKRSGRPLLDLSEQQLIDCVSSGRFTCTAGKSRKY
jgi:C1A family cysteine protease